MNTFFRVLAFGWGFPLVVAVVLETLVPDMGASNANSIVLIVGSFFLGYAFFGGTK